MEKRGTSQYQTLNSYSVYSASQTLDYLDRTIRMEQHHSTCPLIGRYFLLLSFSKRNHNEINFDLPMWVAPSRLTGTQLRCLAGSDQVIAAWGSMPWPLYSPSVDCQSSRRPKHPSVAHYEVHTNVPAAPQATGCIDTNAFKHCKSNIKNRPTCEQIALWDFFDRDWVPWSAGVALFPWLVLQLGSAPSTTRVELS